LFLNYTTWNDKYSVSLFQKWKTYKHRTTIRHFLIRSDISTIYQVLNVSHILYSIGMFLTKSRTLQLRVRMITFFQNLSSKKAHYTEWSTQKQQVHKLSITLFLAVITHIHFLEMLFDIAFTLHCIILPIALWPLLRLSL